MEELSLAAPQSDDATLTFIGQVRTPFLKRHEAPRNVRGSDATCYLEIDTPYRPAMKSLISCSHIVVLYWLDRARRDLIQQIPGFDNQSHGTFALRSPNRPNPIGFAVSELIAVEDDRLVIRYIDALDQTPLLDIKPYFASTDSIPEARVGWFEKRAFPDAPRRIVD